MPPRFCFDNSITFTEAVFVSTDGPNQALDITHHSIRDTRTKRRATNMFRPTQCHLGRIVKKLSKSQAVRNAG